MGYHFLSVAKGWTNACTAMNSEFSRRFQKLSTRAQGLWFDFADLPSRPTFLSKSRLRASDLVGALGLKVTGLLALIADTLGIRLLGAVARQMANLAAYKKIRI